MSGSTDNRPGKSIGHGMLIISFTLIMIALAMLFDNILDRQANPNRLPVSSTDESGMREVILRRNRQGHYVSSGQLNGLPVQFLLDTGATDVAIPLEVARQANLKFGYEGRAQTASGPTAVYFTHISELKVGNIILHDIDASIVPEMGGDTILLGMSALRLIDFSQRGSTLTLRQIPNY